MKYASPILVALIVSMISELIAAEFSAEQRAAQIAPLVTDQTILIAHADLQRVDFRTLAAAQRVLAARSPTETPIFPSLSEQLVTALVDSGARDIYLVLGLEGLPHPQIVIAFATSADQVGSVQKILAQSIGKDARAAMISGLVVVGSQQVIQQLESIRPVARPELAAGFRAAGDSDGQILFIPHMDIRRAVWETTRFPEPVGSTGGRVLAEGIHWAAISVALQPQLSVTVTAQSTDAAAADALRSLIDNVMRAAGAAKLLPIEAAKLEQLASKLHIEGDRLVWIVADADDGGIVRSLAQQALEAANRAANSNNLKLLALAMHNYHDAFKHLPPPAVRNAENKPLLSWRVAILPFIGEQELLKEFHMDEPWDSEHNKKLIERMPSAYADPGADLDPGHTTYLITTGELGLYPSAEGVEPRRIAATPVAPDQITNCDSESAIVTGRRGSRQ